VYDPLSAAFAAFSIYFPLFILRTRCVVSCQPAKAALLLLCCSHISVLACTHVRQFSHFSQASKFSSTRIFIVKLNFRHGNVQDVNVDGDGDGDGDGDASD